MYWGRSLKYAFLHFLYWGQGLKHVFILFVLSVNRVGPLKNTAMCLHFNSLRQYINKTSISCILLVQVLEIKRSWVKGRDAKSPALRWTLQLWDHISSLQIRSKLEIENYPLVPPLKIFLQLRLQKGLASLVKGILDFKGY